MTVAGADAPRSGTVNGGRTNSRDVPCLDSGRLCGTVPRPLELPSCEALEVDPSGGGEPLLVPMVKDAIRSIEPKASAG